MSRPASLPSRSAPGGTLIVVGLVVFLATAIMAIAGEAGDCGGTRSDCEAAFAAGLVRSRILAGIGCGLAGLAVLAWRSGRWPPHAALLVGATVVLAAGVASVVVPAGMPAWVPILIGLTTPGSLLLVVGAYRRLRFARSQPR